MHFIRAAHHSARWKRRNCVDSNHGTSWEAHYREERGLPAETSTSRTPDHHSGL
eukprot:CAMPEP_0196740530 /NCGR_PEP_ID=MMETSP1091-20130531/33271_1 /TAXON_ID=302021 /ORGANISM="Rhodomonas sp., Strain CCMP768" /LENGTH=53 /DNA_ID=CAMNT_0042085741 /DNA_START=50 /DNA_END=207 /DNA_ORIENTATION=+